MKSLKGTKTEKNLEEAFAGESMARNKYREVLLFDFSDWRIETEPH